MASATFEPRNPPRWHHARSRSPLRAESSRRRRCSPSPQGYASPPDCSGEAGTGQTRPPRRNRPEVFQPGAGPRGGVCAVCLGRHELPFAKCESTKLWDGSASAARKTSRGDWSQQAVSLYASTGRSQEAAGPRVTWIDTDAQDAENPITGPRVALERRRFEPLSPYIQGSVGGNAGRVGTGRKIPPTRPGPGKRF